MWKDGGTCRYLSVRFPSSRDVGEAIRRTKRELPRYSLCARGKATAAQSGAFIQRHALHSSSSVQTPIKQLLDKEIITVENKCYFVYDRFFGLWLKTQYGIGYRLENNLNTENRIS